VMLHVHAEHAFGPSPIVDVISAAELGDESIAYRRGGGGADEVVDVDSDGELVRGSRGPH
jgi:hypothetical protein